MTFKRTTTTIILAVIVLFAKGTMAQSQSFKIGKSLEVQMNTLREVANLYVDTVELDKLIKEGLSSMLSSLDPYTMLIPDDDRESIEMLTTGSYGGIGALIRKKDNNILIAEVYEGSAAAKAGLIDGDQIIEINGAPVAPLTVEECSSRMRGHAGTTIKFLVKRLRSDAIEEIIITREKIHIPDVAFYGMVSDSIGYIRITGFTMGGGKDVKRALLELKKDPKLAKIVLDLRGNGGGLMDEAISILSLFLPNNTLVVSSKGKLPQSNIDYFTTGEPVDTLLPISVLVNSGSASASEIVAGALQDLDRATIVGTRTYGKGLVQSIREVGYDNQIKITTAKYYIPSGRCVQAIDYSQRNEDGSVGHIPDSLMRPFKTLNKGRVVYDGGGILPDVVVQPEMLTRPIVALIYSDLLHQYSIEYSKRHLSIETPSKFSLTTQEYNQFVEWAADKEFDHRSAARVEFDKVVKVAKEEGNYNQNREVFEALASKLEKSKKEFLLENIGEIKNLLEEEIVNRYYYQRGRSEIILRNDLQFEEAKKSNIIN